jgi:acyl-CoA thioester hydrolase
MTGNDFPCSVPLEVQFRDLDPFGHVNNAVYFSYFELGRVAYMRRLLDHPLTIGDLSIVVVDASCRYRSPAVLGEQLLLGVRITHIRRSSFAFGYTLWVADSARLVAEGRTIQAAFDHQTKQVKAISPEMRERFERFEGRLFDPREVIPPWGSKPG